jgi:hypothetical protein
VGGDHDSKYRDDVIAPGRQENLACRSADIIVALPASGRNMVVKKRQILQVKVTLRGIRPAIWRRIQVPASYSFWDLHVAIQDAMGWLDYHLHEFRIVPAPRRRSIIIGIPSEEFFPGQRPTQPGWEVPILRHLSAKGTRAEYLYDFGDGWKHVVEVEDLIPREPGHSYPQCIDGRRKCPPEDVGGVWGYEKFLSAIRDPRHEEHESCLTWVGGSYNPDDFDPSAVRFDDPEKRWRMAFLEESGA